MLFNNLGLFGYIECRIRVVSLFVVFGFGDFALFAKLFDAPASIALEIIFLKAKRANFLLAFNARWSGVMDDMRCAFFLERLAKKAWHTWHNHLFC